eukprot:9481603-Pyramimonas_sp.AAC.2
MGVQETILGAHSSLCLAVSGAQWPPQAFTGPPIVATQGMTQGSQDSLPEWEGSWGGEEGRVDDRVGAGGHRVGE